MLTANLYTLEQARRRLGIDRDLVTVLVVVHDIPYRVVGSAKLIDDSGLDLLRGHADDYRRKLQRTAV